MDMERVIVAAVEQTISKTFEPRGWLGRAPSPPGISGYASGETAQPFLGGRPGALLPSLYIIRSCIAIEKQNERIWTLESNV